MEIEEEGYYYGGKYSSSSSSSHATYSSPPAPKPKTTKSKKKVAVEDIEGNIYYEEEIVEQSPHYAKKQVVKPLKRVNIMNTLTGEIIGTIIVPGIYKDPIPNMALGIDLSEIFEEALPECQDGDVIPR